MKKSLQFKLQFQTVKKLLHIIIVMIMVQLISAKSGFAQVSCTGGVPTYSIDFTGNPAGTWISPQLIRSGNCCGTSSPDRCLRFDITLDSQTVAVNFTIASGAVPPGALFYQINCGPQAQVGTLSCITGTGTQTLTFCKPGNNTNTYQVTAIPRPIFPKNDTVRVGCTKTLRTLGLQPGTVTFNSIFPGTPGQYNSYLGCASGCDVTTVTPTTGAPAFVDYRICGYPIADQCGFNFTVCDTVRVYMYPELQVAVSPNPASFCPTTTGVNLSSIVNGGLAPYSYTWKNGSTTVGTAANYFATAAGTYTLQVNDALSASCPMVITSVPVVVANVTITPSQNNVTCFGGSDASATATVNGGSLPYSYSWSNGGTTATINGITAGSYTVTVTDAGGCTQTATYTITQPPDIILSVNNQTNVGCNGENSGGVDINVVGGVGPYTYAWSNGATTEDLTGVSAGTYTLIVNDSRSCADTITVTISQPGGIVPLITSTSIVTGTDISCFGATDGSVSVSVTGGTMPYSYNWSNGGTTQSIGGLGAGPVSVLITDANNCTATANFVLTEPDTLVADIASVSEYFGLYNISCNGFNDGFVDLQVTGGTPSYAYAWSGGATTEDLSNVTAGTYTVTVTDDHGCTATTSVTLIEPDVLVVDATSPLTPNGTNIGCRGESSGVINTAVTGGTAPFDYSWSTGATTSGINGLPAGFYSVTVTDVNNCISMDTITLTEPDTLVPLITSATVVGGSNITCFGQSNGSASVNVVGGSAPYTYLWSTGATTVNVTGLSAGELWVIVYDVNSCSKSDTATISEPSQMTGSASLVNDVSCFGGSNGAVTASASGSTPPYSYAWSSGATTQNVSGLSMGRYYVTITDANSCSVMDSVDISEPALLSGSLSPFVFPSGNNISCTGANDGSIDLTVSGGTAPFSYAWSNTATTQDISGLSPGNYSVTITDANSCTDVVAVTLTEPVPLVIDTIFSPVYPGNVNVSCNGGDDGAVNITVSGGSAPYTYYWSNGDSTQNISNVSVFIYYITVTDVNGCVALDSLWLTEPSLLTTSVASQTNVDCFGNSNGSVTISASGSIPPYSFSIDGVNFQSDSTFSGLPGGTYVIEIRDTNGCSTLQGIVIDEPLAALSVSISTQLNINCNGAASGAIEVSATGGTLPYEFSIDNLTWGPDSVFAGLTAGSYTIYIRDPNGCTDQISTTITQAPNLTSSIFSQPSNCGLDNGIASVTAGGGNPPYTYSWSGGGGTNATATGLANGNYTVVITDNSGCTITDAVTVGLTPLLQASLASSTNNSCNGQSMGSASVSVAGGSTPYQYQWSPSGGTNSMASGLTAGSYSVTVTDADNCTSVVSVQITEPTALTLNISAQPAGCNGNSTGTATANASGGVTPYSYSWSNGDNTVMADSLAAGYVSVLITDANGCTILDSVNITEPQILNASILSTSNVSCFGLSNGSVTMNSPSGGTAPYSILWTNGDTGLLADSLSAGGYSVTITDVNGCSVSLNATITQPAALSLTPSITNATCFGDANGSIVLTVTGGTTSYSYAWSPVSGTGSSISGLNAGSYSVTVTDANGCTITDNIEVIEPAQLLANAGTDLEGCELSFSLNAALPSGFSGQWSVLTGAVTFSNTAVPNTSISNISEGDNLLLWTISDGTCFATDTVEVHAHGGDECALELPTGFSPNGDGFNDGYYIKGIERYPENVFFVFNRWGNEVYRKENYVNSDWIGQNKDGDELPDGTYFVVLQIKNSEIRKNTYVDLRRFKGKR